VQRFGNLVTAERVIDSLQARQRRVIGRQVIDLVVEVNIVLTRVGKGFPFDFVQHAWQDFIDGLLSHKALECKHAVAFEVVPALPEQLLSSVTVELVQGVAIEIDESVHAAQYKVRRKSRQVVFCLRRQVGAPR
jgi:SAM-dependent MidA family methyltransferase